MYSVPTTVSSLLPTTDLPPVETRTEHVFRISSWVIQSSPVARLGDDEDLDNDSSSTEHAALDYIAKVQVHSHVIPNMIYAHIIPIF